MQGIPAVGGMLVFLTPTLINVLVGLLLGALVLLVVTPISKVLKKD